MRSSYREQGQRATAASARSFRFLRPLHRFPVILGPVMCMAPNTPNGPLVTSQSHTMISFTKYQSPTAPTLPPGLFTFSSFDGAQGKTNPSSASISSFAGGFFVITLLTVGTSITDTCAAAAAAAPPASACKASAEPTAADFGASGVPRLGPTLKTTSFRCRRSIRRSSLLKNPPDCLPRTLMPPPCVLLCLGLDDLSLPSRNVGPSSSAAASGRRRRPRDGRFERFCVARPRARRGWFCFRRQTAVLTSPSTPETMAGRMNVLGRPTGTGWQWGVLAP